MSKINILQAINTLGMGGAQKTLQIYTKYLDKRWFNVTVCGVDRGGPRAELLQQLGYDVYITHGDKDALVRLMREKDIHILHLHLSVVLGSPALRAAKEAGVVAVVATNIFGRPAPAEVERYVDRHLHISKSCALRYQKWKSITNQRFFDRHRVVYYPVDLEEFDAYAATSGRLEKMRLKLGISDASPVIGRIGRPAIGKWSDLCIRMMPHLVRRVPNVKYLMMGVPEAKKAEIENSNLADHFVFLEPSPDPVKVVEFYGLIDVLAHSSRIGESFGLVIAEAMAARVPVVVNSTPLRDNAQIELVDHGITGWIANTPESYAEAVAELLLNPALAKKMGEAGRHKVESTYAATKVVRMLEKTYVDVLREKGCPLDPDMVEHYSTVEEYPSARELGDFREEYRRRLRTCWGNPKLWEIWAYEWLAGNYAFHQVGKQVKDLLERFLRKE